MDAAQEARAAEINAALQRRGSEQIGGAERTALVHELGALLGAGAEPAAMLAPEGQARADEITRRLQDHALGKPDAYLEVFERGRLRDELVRLTGADGTASPPASTDGSGDGAGV